MREAEVNRVVTIVVPRPCLPLARTCTMSYKESLRAEEQICAGHCQAWRCRGGPGPLCSATLGTQAADPASQPARHLVC